MDGNTNAMDTNLGKFQEMVRDKDAGCAVVHGVAESDTTGHLNNSNDYNHKRSCKRKKNTDSSRKKS